MHLTAPFSSEQVQALRLYQESDFYHPYTCPKKDCGSDAPMDPRISGLRCCSCGYVQTWVLNWTGDLEMVKQSIESNWRLIDKMRSGKSTIWRNG